DRAPELIVLSIDERVHVEAFRRKGTAAIEVHDRLDPEHGYGYSGYHGIGGERRGRLQRGRGGGHPRAAARPRLRVTAPRLDLDVPEGFAAEARWTLETLLGACAAPTAEVVRYGGAGGLGV